jgi:TusA-related sulfurtransferase
MQDRSRYSINSADTSINRSKQLEAAIPPSKIAALSSGEFVGMVADNPDQKIELKAFHCEMLNDHAALKKEQENYKEVPVIKMLDNAIIQRNYLQIKQDIQDFVQSQMELLLNDPSMKHLVINKHD